MGESYTYIEPKIRCGVCKKWFLGNLRFAKVFICRRCQVEVGAKTMPELEKKRAKEERSLRNKEKILKAKKDASLTKEAKEARKLVAGKILGRKEK